MDKLHLLLVTGLTSMALGVGCLAFIGFRSVASPTLVLATATMVSAVVFFSLQLKFSLREDKTLSVFGVEVTIDHSRPGIWHSKAHRGNVVRRAFEGQAGEWLAKHNGQLFARKTGEDPIGTGTDKVARDLLVYSVLAYISNFEPGWRLDTVSLRTTFGTLMQIPRGTSDKDCTLIDKARIHRLLSDAGNVFSGAVPSSFDSIQISPLCLPPQTRISLAGNDLVLENPFCRIFFHLEEPTASIWNANVEPGSRDIGTPLDNDHGRFETRVIGMWVNVTHFSLRSQHADAAKYRAWSERLVQGVRRWFEGAQQPA